MKITALKQSGLFILSGLLLYGSLSAQYRRSIEVKKGEDIAKAYSANGFYRFPQFSKGALFSRMRSGNSDQLFNYDLLNDKIQFISHGDTMEMTNPTLFDSVKMNNQVFYYREGVGFLELVASADPVKLVRKTSIKLKTQTIGAYDGATTTAAVNKINSYTFWPNVYTFSVNEDVVIKESVDWFLIDNKGDIKKATHKNLLYSLPPGKQAIAEDFIKQYKTDFDKEAEIASLVKALR